MLDALLGGGFEAVASWELAAEIADVLRRPRLARYEIGEEDVEAAMFALAPFLPAVEVDVELRDPNDAPVVASAIAGEADAIVTGDADLLEDAEARAWLEGRGVEVLSPAELIERFAGERRWRATTTSPRD